MRAGRGRPTRRVDEDSPRRRRPGRKPDRGCQWARLPLPAPAAGRRPVVCRRTEPLNAVKKEDISVRILNRLCTALIAVPLLAACAGPAAPTPPKEGVVVTFRVAGVEDYKIRLTDPADIEVARE